MIDLRHIELVSRHLDLRLGRRGGRPEPGERRVAIRGHGLTFAGLREYEPGDDVRNIDWNVTARFGRPHVKVYQQEMAGVVLVALDVSASMSQGRTGAAKRAAALEAAALFLFAASRRDERVGAVAFTDRIERHLSARRGRHHALRLVHALDATGAASPRTNLRDVLRRLDHLLRLPAVVVVISDFADEDFAGPLGRLSVRHDVIGVAIRDRRERELPDRRLAWVEDVETGDAHWVDTSSRRVREAWAARWSSIAETARRSFRSIGAPLVEIEAGEPWLHSVLARHVTTRSAVPR